MASSERLIDYTAGDVTFEGLFVPAGRAPAPAVLVAHTWAGRGSLEDDKARELAAMGYSAMSCDVYGKGVRGTTREENAALLKTMRDDRPLLLTRLMAGIETLRAQPEVDADRIAAIGYCFGGLCVLDIARSGADVAGVVSFHGLLGAPDTATRTVRARVLALHGWDDPMATPADVTAFASEMSAAGADWQLHAYGGTVHAFTNPGANDAALGTVYNPLAAARAWQSMTNFLSELFEQAGG